MTQSAPQGIHSRRNPDGSEVWLDGSGLIIATRDVLGDLREFSIEPKTGRLMVKRFGLWTQPESARVEADGSLYFRRGDVEILERLDGVNIQANKAKGLVIKNDPKNKIEVIEMANGETWKRHITDDVERFWIWKNDQPKFRSETYFKVCRHTAATPIGHQALSYVSRFEESYERGVMVRQKFSFNNDLNNERHVPIALQLGRAMLMLRNVGAVITTFSGDQPTETIYKLELATNLKVESPGTKVTFENVMEVRSFVNPSGVSAGFKKANGSEQVLPIMIGESGAS